MHVIEWIRKKSGDGKVLLRMNLRNGGVDYVETNAGDWRFHPDLPLTVDVAILTWIPSQDQFDYLFAPEWLAVTEDMINHDHISIGDEVFIVGLFSEHSGQERNLPIIRVGHVAMLPEEPIKTEHFDPMVAYLIEGGA
jgi:hypothetical protein